MFEEGWINSLLAEQQQTVLCSDRIKGADALIGCQSFCVGCDWLIQCGRTNLTGVWWSQEKPTLLLNQSFYLERLTSLNKGGI